MSSNIVKMYRLSCRDLGIDDDFVAQGKTRAEVILKMTRYVARVHGVDIRGVSGHSMIRLMRPVV